MRETSPFVDKTSRRGVCVAGAAAPGGGHLRRAALVILKTAQRIIDEPPRRTGAPSFADFAKGGSPHYLLLQLSPRKPHRLPG